MTRGKSIFSISIPKKEKPATEIKIYKDKIPPDQVKLARFVRESGGLGDVIRVLAMGQGMRIKYPNAKIHYFGPYYLQRLIAPRSKAFDIYFPFKECLRPRDVSLNEKKYPHLYTGYHYDVSLEGWCPAYLHEPNTKGICCQDRTELWCSVGGLPITRPVLTPTPEDLVIRDRYLAKKKTKYIIGIQPGATCPSREWPYAYWDTLCQLLINKDVHIILFDVCYRWREHIRTKEIEYSIDCSWPETIGKVLACDLIISPDSGFFHLAGALKKRALGLFGCTNGEIMSRPWCIGEKTAHYLQLRHEEIETNELPDGCIPRCYMRWERGWKADRYRSDEKDYCVLLKQLSPDRVLREIFRLLNDPQNNSENIQVNQYFISQWIKTKSFRKYIPLSACARSNKHFRLCELGLRRE